MADKEIHVVGDVMVPHVEAALRENGYRRDDFRPGDVQVVRPYHFVSPAASVPDLDARWDRLTALLTQNCPDGFRGFAEAEITEPGHRATFELRPFAEDVEFPLQRFSPEVCPAPNHKAFDVHVIADLDTLDARLDRMLVEAGFYLVDILTRTGYLRRCYTIQPMKMDDAPALFDALKGFFARVGGFRGKIKLERAHAFARFPNDARVPPVVMTVAYRSAGADPVQATAANVVLALPPRDGR